MLNFREEFIKYLNEKYVDIFCEDITRFLEKNNQKIQRVGVVCSA